MNGAVPRPRRLDTPRLALRPLTHADDAAFHVVNTHPAVRRYLFDDRVMTPGESAAMVAQSIELLEREGHGLFGVAFRADAALVGWAGFLHGHAPPVLEIAYALLPEHWGRGIAVEATRAVMTWGARHLRMTEFHASTDAPNLASIRVLEKLGFRETRRTHPPPAALVHFTLDATRVDQSGVACVVA
jgi:[ribosomal protein S5]-alanine N-acetyltransferase